MMPVGDGDIKISSNGRYFPVTIDRVGGTSGSFFNNNLFGQIPICIKQAQCKCFSRLSMRHTSLVNRIPVLVRLS